MIKHIPNAITLVNLFCGSVAVALVFMSFEKIALVLCGVCLIADLLDGMVARLLNADSDIGVQLDSLADVISFGLLPGIILFYLLQRFGTGDISVGFSILAFLIPVSAGFRLAKFNVDTRERGYFYGLPTPAGALFAFGLLWMLILPQSGIATYFLNPYFLYATIFVMVIAYHLPVELPNLKGSRTSKIWLAGILVTGVLFFIFARALTFFVIPLCYLLIGVIHRFVKLY